MKKVIGLLIVFISFILLVPNIKALNVEISEISLDSKSDSISVLSEPEIDGFNIDLNFEFKELNTFIKYKVDLINNDKDEYIVFTDSESNCLKYTIDNNKIESKKTNTIYITIELKDTVALNDLDSNGNLNTTINLKFKEKDGKIITPRNPKTYDNIYFLICLFVIAVVGLVIGIRLLDKKKKNKVEIILLFLMVPLFIKASTISQISLNLKIKIDDSLVVDKIKYKVIHKKMNLDGNTYNIEETEEFYGIRNTKVSPETKEYEGFNRPNKKEIALDSNEIQVVEYLYDRKELTLNIPDRTYLTDNSSPNGTYLYGQPIILSAQDREGYNFVKWSNDNNNQTIQLNITENLEIYPVYEVIKYKISFNSNGGTSVQEIDVEYKNEIGELPTASKEGYSLFGWYSDSSLNNKINKKFVPTEDTILYAKWLENNNCTFEGELTQGTEFIKDQYVYRYMQSSSNTGWGNITYDGWGVSLIDKNSTDPVTSELCTYINNKPIVSMAYMFNGSKASSIDTSSFVTNNVKNMDYMFNNTEFNEIDLSTFNTSNVTSMVYMFANTKIDNIDLSTFDISNVKYIVNMFSNSVNLETIDLSMLDATNLLGASNMFAGCTKLKNADLSNFSLATSSSYLFNNCPSLEEVKMVGWNYISSIPIQSLFGSSYSTVKKLDLSNTVFGESMAALFNNMSNLEEIILDNVDTSKTKTMNSLFVNCTSIKNIDLTSFDTTNVINMGSMFNGCSSLEKTDVSSFRTPKLENVSSMYANSGVKEVDLGNFDTSSLTGAGYLVGNCRNLEYLNISGWDLRKVQLNGLSGLTGYANEYVKRINMSNVKFGQSLDSAFQNAHNLEEIDLTGADTSETTVMYDLFYDCPKLEHLDLTSLDVSKVTTFGNAFSYCTNLKTIDISTWDTSSLQGMNYLFYGSTNLETIYASDKFVVKNTAIYGSLFNNTKLVGGMGTEYSSSYTNGKYAHVDLGELYPGYFTDKNASNYYYLAYDSNGGKDLYGVKATNKGQAIGELVEPEWDEWHVFEGWYTGIDSGILVDENYTPNTNIKIFARWREIPSYTITFNVDGGSNVSNIRIEQGTAIGELPTTTKYDYYFDGWYSDSGFNNLIDENYIPTDNETIYAKWNNAKCDEFATDSWETIKTNVAKDPAYYKVGCTRPIEFDLEEGGTIVHHTHTLRVANNTINKSKCLVEGDKTTTCGFVVEFADIITNHRMNPYTNGNTNGDGTGGGWVNSELREYLNNDIYNAFPEDLKNVIVNTRVTSTIRANASTLNYSTEKLYLLNTGEVWKTTSYGTNSISYLDSSYNNNSSQLDYYRNLNNTTSSYSASIKLYNGVASNWWLRPIKKSSYSDFLYVTSTGYYGSAVSTSEYGISPAFRIE